MALTIGEANDLNVLLRYALNLSYGMDTEGNDLSHSSDQAREAAERLADKANKTLGAGLTAARVRAAWPEENEPLPDFDAREAQAAYDDEWVGRRA